MIGQKNLKIETSIMDMIFNVDLREENYLEVRSKELPLPEQLSGNLAF